MLFFWVLAGLLTCLAVVLVARPLLRRTERLQADEERRLAVYRDRRAELRSEHAAGRLTDAEAVEAERELLAEAARQFGEVSRADTGDRPLRGPRRIVWALVVAVAIPLVALPAYHLLGAPGLVGLDAATLRGELTPERLTRLVAELEQRVARAPGDGEGWAMLAEALRMSEAAERAAQAYEKATALLPQNARLLTDYAETLVVLQKGEFAGRPVALLERALQLDPNDAKAIALMGAAQYRLGNLGPALKYLRQLSGTLTDDSPQARQINAAIVRIEAELTARGGVSPRTENVRDGSAAAASAKGTTPTTGAASAKPGAAALAGSIAIEPGLKARATPGATLFVVARAAEGPRIPIAVLRLPVGTAWPVRFELSDAQAMDPSRTLSSVDRVVVEARISASGEATRRSGDVFGVSAPLKPGTRDIALRIDQQVP